MKKIVLIIMAVFGLVIVGLNIGAMSYYMLTSSSANDIKQSIEGTIISNGLAMVSLAITVWIGITIYNVISKKDIEELKSALEKYSPLSEQVSEYTKQQLVNQMYKVGDKSCDFIAKCFDKSTEIPIERYADLLTIDILLEKAYMPGDKSLKRKWADIGIEKINKYKGKFNKRCKLENSYLNYREGDFWFYIAADCEGTDKLNAYKKSKCLFVNSLNDFGISIPWDKEFSATVDEERLELSVYFANAIGLCLSKMMGYKSAQEKEVLKDEAYKYLKFAVKYSKMVGEREVYYRNYGCLIENTAESVKDLEEAYNQYKEAFRVSSENSSTYYVLISNLNKRIKMMLGIETRIPEKNREKSLFEMSFIGVGDKNRIAELIQEMGLYLDTAIHFFPNNASWYAFSIYRKIYTLCIYEHLDFDKKKRYLNSMKQDVARIKLLKGQSALCIVAEKEVNDLEDYLSTV